MKGYSLQVDQIVQVCYQIEKRYNVVIEKQALQKKRTVNVLDGFLGYIKRG